MSFLKDFKDDLSQAVNELVTDEEYNETEQSMGGQDDEIDEEAFNTALESSLMESIQEIDEEEMLNQEIEELERVSTQPEPEPYQEQQELYQQVKQEPVFESFVAEPEPSVLDEVSEITAGSTIEGNISSSGSINITGTVRGNVVCKGKLVVSGMVVGASQASEIFTNNAKIEGDVASQGSIKIGNGSIIIGNVYATSAVIGGAVKGDIDVHGPVIVDATAVVQGNIKSRSVQINNGAIIEGHCSQCYSEVDYQALFDDAFTS